jgi:glucokinase
VVELAGGNPDDVTGEHVTAAAAGGDPEALELMARLGRFVAIGIANLVNIFDPRVVVLGGGLIKAGEVLMAPVRASLDGLAMGARVRPQVPVLPAMLGERSGAVGAGLMAMSVSPQGGVAT